MARYQYTDESDFEKVKADSEALYTQIGSAWCPYFGERIVFNPKGIRHLKFKSDRVARPRRDQYSRLKLLSLAPTVLQRSGTVQGIWQTRRLEHEKTNSRWQHVMHEVCFYEFMAVIDATRLKVIVKQVGDGEKYFWSVIPFWGIDKGARRRILYSGNPESD